MRVTKSQLKRIIREEYRCLQEAIGANEMGGMNSPEVKLDQISDIIKQTKMNKSLGFNPDVAKKALKDIRKVLDLTVRSLGAPQETTLDDNEVQKFK